MRVEFIGNSANRCLMGLRRIGEGEWVETAGLYIDWIVAHTKPSASADRPDTMNARLQSSKTEGVTKRDDDQLVIGQNNRIQKDEDAVLHRFDRCDVPVELH